MVLVYSGRATVHCVHCPRRHIPDMVARERRGIRVWTASGLEPAVLSAVSVVSPAGELKEVMTASEHCIQQTLLYTWAQWADRPTVL